MSYRVVAKFIHSGCEVHGIAAIIMGHGYPLGGGTNSDMDSQSWDNVSGCLITLTRGLYTALVYLKTESKHPCRCLPYCYRAVPQMGAHDPMIATLSEIV